VHPGEHGHEAAADAGWDPIKGRSSPATTRPIGCSNDHTAIRGYSFPGIAKLNPPRAVVSERRCARPLPPRLAGDEAAGFLELIVRDNVAVRVERACKSFGSVQAVQELDLVVSRRVHLRHPGPNGAGKTTLIRILMDIIAPDSGRVEVLGTTTLARVKDHVGYLPEERGLYRKMRVGDTLTYFGTIKKRTRRALAGTGRPTSARGGA